MNGDEVAVPRRRRDPIAAELAALRRMKGEVARVSGLLDDYLATFPEGIGGLYPAADELMRLNARWDGRLGELRSSRDEGTTSEQEAPPWSTSWRDTTSGERGVESP